MITGTRNRIFLALTLLGSLFACSAGPEAVPEASVEAHVAVSEAVPSALPAVAAHSAPEAPEEADSAVSPTPKPETEVSPLLTIVYTNNIDGEIEPCG